MASDDVDWLLNQVAALGSSRRRGPDHSEDEDAAHVVILAMFQRRWGVMAARANAQLLLDRPADVGRGACAADARRVAARGTHAARRQRSWLHAGPFLHHEWRSLLLT